MANVYDFQSDEECNQSVASPLSNILTDSESEFDGFRDDDIVGVPTPPGSDLLSDVDISSVSSPSESDDSSDEADTDTAEHIPQWTRQFVNDDVHVPLFTQSTGPNLPNIDAAIAGPNEYFQVFLTDNLVNSFVTHTNSYAQFVIQNKRASDPSYVDSLWYPTHMCEMRAFIGLNVFFGLNPLPNYKQYWSTDPFLGNEGIRSVMPVKRYEKLAQYFHVSDRSQEPPRGAPNYDRLYKVRPVLDAMQASFKNANKPSKCQSLDEGMIKFQGRITYLQYMPAKPIRRGIKVWVMSDSHSGYMNRFEIYLGRKATNVSDKGLYFDIVSRLTYDLRGKNHHVFFDNLYTSIPLLVQMHKLGILCCGTIRKNRKFLPNEVKNPPARCPRGNIVTMQDASFRNLSCTVWRDTKDVRFASVLNKAGVNTTTLRRISGTYNQVSQPLVAKLYQRYYAGVDRFDQLRSTFSFGRESKKSWKYLFNFLMNSAVVNAFILYKANSTRPCGQKRYTQALFRAELGHSFIAGYSNKHRVAAPNPRLHLNQPQNVDHHENSHMRAKRARYCHTHKKFTGERKETVYGCKTCNVHLCKECHHRFHAH
jgi:hypothetical protein